MRPKIRLFAMTGETRDEGRKLGRHQVHKTTHSNTSSNIKNPHSRGPR